MSTFKAFTTCQAVVCDLDGTLYLENTPIPGALETLNAIAESGRQLFYFTNNTSASREVWLQKIKGMDFPIQKDQLITSADCADSYLKRHNLFPNIYLVGNRDLKTDFAERGFNCLSEQEALITEPAALVLGFDTELTYKKIYTCYQLILRDIPYIATHPDRLCPVTKNTFKPDVGSFISLFETATGGRLPIVVGKPTQEAVQVICERAKLRPEQIAFIGDRLYTDIRMAATSGMVGVLVLSGETNRADVDQAEDKPDIIVESIADLAAHL